MPRKRNPLTGDLMMEGITAVVSPRTGKVTFRARPTWTDGSGKRQFDNKTFKTYEEAEDWHLDTLLKIRRGTYSRESTLTVSDYYAEWQPRMARIWESSTRHFNARYWRLHIEPEIGNLRIQRVTRRDLQRMVDRLLVKPKARRRDGEPLSATTVKIIMSQVSGLFSSAVTDGVITINPASKLVYPATPRKPAKVWTPLQMRRFLSGVRSTPEFPLWLFMTMTGCRVGELTAVRVGDVNMDTGVVWIHRTARKDDDGGVIYGEGTKTSDQGISVPLEPEMVAVLRPLHDGRPPDAFLFVMDTGEPYQPNTVRKMLEKEITRIGLPRLTPHGFRHSAATTMIANGVPESVVKRILGHSSITMTVDTYTHMTTGDARVGTSTLSRLLGISDNGSESPQKARNDGEFSIM